MKTHSQICLLMIFGCLIFKIESANILGIFPTNTHSHYVMYGSLMRELARRGHQITVVSHFPAKNPIRNFVDISLEGTLPAFTNNISIDVPLAMTPLENHFDIITDCYQSCEIGLKNPEVQELMNPKYKFDLIITEIFGSECYLGMSYKLGVPSVGIVSSVTLPWVNDMVANPDNPSYVPLYFFGLTQWMNFFERLYNTVMTIVIKVTYEIMSNWESQRIVEDALGPVPPISTLAKNFSVILTNSHFSINQVRPFVPQMIEVGGLHIGKIGKLPKDIEEFMNESANGVVYFSFGSMLKIDSIPKEKLEQIINVLGNLKQRVLWKVNATNLPNLPKNIKTGLWMPQLEILCHPATKVFISHGGLLGSQESIYCGVPILGVPLFADQALNLGELKKRGVAEVVNYYDLNEDTMSTTLDKLINDNSYTQNMDLLSQLFKDRPQHPLETAVYWMEYVIKYKGAKHLRSAALELTWYQYLLLDVIAFIVIAVIVLYNLVKYLLRNTIRKTQTNRKINEYKIENQNSLNNNSIYQNGKPISNGHTKINGYSTYQNGYEVSNNNGTIHLSARELYSTHHTKDD